MSTELFADARRTVTALERVATGARDSYGNAVLETHEIDVANCLVAPGGSDDDQQNADRTTTTATIYDMSGTWPGGTVNRCRFDGAQWEIVGDPDRWQGPIGGTVIRVRKVAG